MFVLIIPLLIRGYYNYFLHSEPSLIIIVTGNVLAYIIIAHIVIVTLYFAVSFLILPFAKLATKLFPVEGTMLTIGTLLFIANKVIIWIEIFK